MSDNRNAHVIAEASASRRFSRPRDLDLVAKRILPWTGADFLKQIDSAITQARATVMTLER